MTSDVRTIAVSQHVSTGSVLSAQLPLNHHVPLAVPWPLDSVVNMSSHLRTAHMTAPSELMRAAADLIRRDPVTVFWFSKVFIN